MRESVEVKLGKTAFGSKDKNKVEQLKDDIRRLGDILADSSIHPCNREIVKDIMSRNNFVYSKGEMGYILDED